MCTGHASRMDRGGGTEPVSGWPTRVWPARRRRCRAAVRPVSRPAASGPGLAEDVAAVRQALSQPPAVVADRPGVLLWHELRCDADADSAVAKVLADRLAPAGQQALGAIALVSERAPTRPPTSLLRWTNSSGRSRQVLCSDARLPRVVEQQRRRGASQTAAPAGHCRSRCGSRRARRVLTVALRGEAKAAPDGVLLAQTRSRGCQQAPAVTPALRWIGSEQQSEPPASRRRFATR